MVHVRRQELLLWSIIEDTLILYKPLTIRHQLETFLKKKDIN